MSLSLDRQCQLAGFIVPQPEYKFAAHLSPAELRMIGQTKPRRWAIDWAWPAQRLALEVEGGYAMAGRHTSAKGFIADQEKYNALACLGWRLLRVTPRDVKSGLALSWIQLALKGANGNSQA